MTSNYEAAKAALDSGNFEEAVTKGSAALASFKSSKDADGIEKVAKVLVEAYIATDMIAEGKAQVKELTAFFQSSGNTAGQACMLLLSGGLSCAEKEAAAALSTVETVEGLIPGAGEKSQKLTMELFELQVKAYLLQSKAEAAMSAAKELRAKATQVGSVETEAAAWHYIANAYEAQEEGATPADCLTAAEKSLGLYKEQGILKGQAAVLSTMARAQLQQDKTSAGLQTATDSLKIFKDLNNPRGMVTALETIVQAHSMHGEPWAGIKVAQTEVETLAGAGNKRGEADILEMIAQTHATLGQSRSAMAAAQKAMDIYISLGDKAGEAGMLLTMAEMSRAMGGMPEATEFAEKSLRCFREAGSKWGEEQALVTLSGVYVSRGQPEKSPKRAEVQRALKELAKSIEGRKVEDFKAAEEKLNGMLGLLADGEVQGILTPILQKDPTAVEFLEEQGWKFQKDETNPQKVKSFPHRGFYLHMIMTGMNFGPQFRSVYPYRVGDPDPEKSMTALSASQLPETEAWQMGMGYRPGLLDSCLQCQASLAFP